MALSVDLPAALPDTQTLAFHAQIFGRSNTPHFLRIWVNQTIAFDTTVQFSQVSLREHPFSFFAASPNAPLNLQFEALRSPVDNNHLTGLSIVYRRLPDLLGEKQAVLDHWPQSETIRLDLTQIDGSDSLYVWDTQLGIRSKGLITSSQGQVLVPLSPASQNVRIVSDLGVQTPLIQSIPRLNNLCAPDSGAQFVIISHRSLAASAEAYAHYRDTSGIEPLSSRVVYVDEIYEEFGYGSITPLAIKRFVNCALSNWNTPPEYLLMWGNGSYLIRENPWIKVPYYGYPANDLEYTRDLSSTTIVESLVSVGRLNINNNVEGFAYLNKLDRFEHRPLDNWQQRGIFLGAGATIGEIDAIESGLTYVRQQFVSPPMNGSSIYFGYDGQPQVPTPVLDSNFFQWMDQGVGLMHYFGHSTNQLWQIEVGEPEDYQNIDRPLALFAYGCNSSSFVDTNKVLLERWIASPDRGAIACVGITGAGYLNPLRDFQRIFADGYYPIDPSQRIGDVMRHSINLYTDSLDGVQYRNHARYLLLQGDPAVRIFAPAYAPADSVWPGDVNDDGVANMDDLLRIGLAYGDSGYARVNPTINWQAQAAIAWSQSFADGVNHKHADCDGDGLVVASDTLAISQNYGLIHQKTEENNFTAAGIPLTLYFPQSVNPGDTATVEVWAGDSLNPVSLYGLRFELSYDTAQVSTDQIWVDMSDSWLGTPGQNLLSMYKVLPNEAQIHQGITRIDHQALLGGGKVSDINIVITDDIAKQPWNLQSIVLKNGQAFDEVGNDIPLNALAAWNNELPPITPLYTRIFPNPAAEQICIERTDHQVKDFRLLDMRGRVCANWTEKEVEIGCLSLEGVHAGLYLLVFEEDELRRTLKIVIEES
ncbi:MAG: C25 family cysteine peptidase [Bacteroidota bacterium]